MKKQALFLLLALCLGLAACKENADQQLEEAEIQSLPSEQNGVSMEAGQKMYAPDAEKMTILIENKSEQEVVYGKHFTMEKKVDGVWRMVPVKDGAAFVEIALFISSEEMETEVIPLYLFHQPLSEGTYRIVKKIGGQSLAADFIIE